MHELSITRELLDLALEEAERAGARRVDMLTVVIGEFSGVIEESIIFFFEMISKSTLAEGARIVFERERPTFECGECGNEYQPFAGSELCCPKCNSMGRLVNSARGVYLKSMDVDVDEDRTE